MITARMSQFFFLSVFVVANFSCTSGQNLRPCELYEDTYGEWIPNPAIGPAKDVTKFEELKRHYLGSIGPGQSVEENWDIVWKTSKCAYHRFTNESLHSCVKHMIHKNLTATHDHVRLWFIGDSAVRGVLCGIARIIAGSEVYGPCINEICGGILDHAVSYKEIGRPFDVKFFDGKLVLTFVYVKSFIDWYRTDWLIHDILPSQPYAMIVNTGIWDYDNVARAHRGEDAPDYCNDNRTQEISNNRASAEVNKTLVELGLRAKEYGVRLIYRTNHYNVRFGVNCADDQVLEILNHTEWEIWDNRRVSRYVFKNQTWDGFHFERVFVQTKEAHEGLVKTGVYYNVYGAWMTWMHAGSLEIQLAQSALQALFHPCLKDKFHTQTRQRRRIRRHL